ncbi:unnamed protein product [Parnassius mnemosyne]|uniref:Uncharacterized protein n=1 Tax=Parnassius mnemosyne TaxID=213953 RepID=A0AAV1LM58_9NEOP
MTVLSKVFCLILLLCILNSVTGDLASFFATLPTEIGNAFSGAWNRITETIRRPVRIKRLGKGGRRKTTTTLSTEMTTVTKSYFHSSTNPMVKITIPIIPKPHWKSMMERPNIPYNVKKNSETKIGKNLYEGVINESEKADEESNEGIYNILFFI